MKRWLQILKETGVVLVFAVTGYAPVAAQSAFSDDAFTKNALQRLEIMSGKIPDELHLSEFPYQRKQIIAWLDSNASSENISGDSLPPSSADKRIGIDAVSRTDVNTALFLRNDNDEWLAVGYSASRKPILKYFYRDKATLYQHRSDDFLVKVNPVFDFEVGKETAGGQTLFMNTRGVSLRGWIAKKVGYNFFVTENQAREPLYVRERIDSFGAVPGEGYYKNFKTGGIDFFHACGSFDFTVAKFITVQFGNGSNFLGNGLRSLALSDFSGDYLFLKLQTQVWKLQYQNLFMDLTADFLRGSDQLLPKKFAAVHHLSINVARFMNVGVFESVVFHRNNGFELQYLNPIIFYRSVEQLIGSPDNTLLGADYRINFLHHFSYYGQAVLDDYNVQQSKGTHGYWGNKLGIQQGLKYVNAFSVPDLDLQAEWNSVRPYTYTHDDSIANYSNYNQPLAHPLGANFNELIGIIRYQPVFPVQLEALLLSATQGRDTSNSNYGADIFIPTAEGNVAHIDGNEVTQGVKSRLLLFQFTCSFMIRHNLYADFIYAYRQTTADLPAFNSTTNIFRAGIRMNMGRRTWNF